MGNRAHLRVSFIIPVRNESARLRENLRAIRKSEISSGKIQIVVADNGSTDDSRSVARNAGALVLELPGLNVTALRNRAVAEAESEVLAFCDADNMIGPGWVTTAQELLEDPQVAAVGAPYHPPEPPTWVQRTYDGLREHCPGTRETRWLGAGNMAVRRSAFVAVGGFDESLTTCEDVDLCNRLRKAGWKLLSDSRLHSVHLGDPETLQQVFMGELWRGRDNLKVSLRGPLRWQDLPGILFPVANLGFIAAAVLGALAAPIGGWLVFGLGCGGFCTLSALRSLRILRQSRLIGWRQAHQAFVVASIYELARSLALIWRVDHHRNRET
ncbi:MAG: glycosyltransferase [Thermoanaerobaculia bacterium]